jgi:hypothetical protein
VLALLAGVMVVGFAGYRGFLYYQASVAKNRPALASISKKAKSRESQNLAPAEPSELTEPSERGEAPSASAGGSRTSSKGADTTDASPAVPTPSAPSEASPAPSPNPMGDDFSSIVGRMPPEKAVTEPDPRQTGGFQGEIFVRLDLNGDLKLEPMEIPTYYREQMLAGDTSNDGKINFTEFRDALSRLPEPPATRSTVQASALINPPLPGQEIPIYERVADRKAKDAPLWFTNYDRSGDGHIAVYEWPAGRLNEFRALDTNNDGFITLEEAKKAEQLKQSMEPPTSTNPASDRPNGAGLRPSEVGPRVVGR